MSETIASLAAHYKMQPYELQALTDTNEWAQDAPLAPGDEEFIRDVVENTDKDGVYGLLG